MTKMVDGVEVPLSAADLAQQSLDEASAAALPMEELRYEGGRRLAASDWTQLADAPVDITAWATYRQALRDLPQAFPEAKDVVWPKPPQ